MALTDLTLAELLDQIAARTPAPGGGSAAAWTGATAAALVEMAAAFAPPDRAEDLQPELIRERAAALRAQLAGLADQDLDSYRPVLEALALPPDDDRRAAALDAALSEAAEVPLAIATASAEVAALAASVREAGSVHLTGDATAAALLAEAAARAAVRLVELNLARAPQDPRLRLASKLAERAWAQRAEGLRGGPGS